ncbi:U4/U6-U5 snRNP complex subunit PRP31 [Aspergillus clavatus NRRL 1]|uniref:Pre-mRNA splicing factor (Prp31), putative n=1 Tax=Aspergillus clavatus (strain ATCC 1007 / CBS 513.65 / DSM 816 / NCTC 3887 / NRRL 1 / QM 1276 / 107) TaxID=344612 RepID=A1CQ97_ASPCL|nr:pre-mRNA splicing factor (Prp31), putative [Aspergillus clavatus NRRL 1]EAW07818.1 pre-mRNA splicing factor (Prp31), putative [Aspergillus clavatus NRRL 1]
MSNAEELLRDFESDDEDFQAGEEIEEDVDEEALQQPAPEITNEFDVAVSTTDELTRLHKSLRDHYSIRFPELETLVTNPIDYAKTVAILKNGPLNDIKALSTSADNMVGAPLRSILDGPSLMVVAVEGTTTRGREMTESELQAVLDTCERILKLDRERTALTQSIQSRMSQIAPNLAALIGPETAAQFLNQTGGLRELAKIPACNLAAQGSKRTEGLGFATNIGIRSQGFLYHSPIIEDIPNDLKKQAMRIVSAKMVLATRADVSQYSPDGSLGEELKQQCYQRLEKLTEPAPNSGVKALPAPDDKPSRKRGGRRARKAKEAVAMTELRKAQNRLAFGKEEAEVGYGTGEGTVGLGMLGQQNDGRIRATQIDQRTRAKLSKSNKGWGAATPVGGTASSLRGFGSGAGGTASVLQAKGLRTSGVGTSLAGTAGTASTIAFTPVQGLELVDPKVQAELQRKRKAEEDRWFKSGTFTQVGGQSNSTKTGENGGFKVPPLPARKKVDTGEGKMAPPPPPVKP